MTAKIDDSEKIALLSETQEHLRKISIYANEVSSLAKHCLHSVHGTSCDQQEILRLKRSVAILIEGMIYCKDYVNNNEPERPYPGSAGQIESDIEQYLDKAGMELGADWREIETEHFTLDSKQLEE